MHVLNQLLVDGKGTNYPLMLRVSVRGSQRVGQETTLVDPQ